MQLSDKNITQFQELYAAKFGRELPRAEALETGTKLVRLIQLTYKPITPVQYQEAQAKQKQAL